MSYEGASGHVVVPRSDLAAALFGSHLRWTRHVAASWSLTLGVFAAAGVSLPRTAPAMTIVSAPLEVELMPAPRAEPPAAVAAPALAPRIEQPVARAIAPHRAPASKAAEAVAPTPARAGALVTAKDEPTAESPDAQLADFVNDANQLGFGAGVVAVGGGALVGPSGARPGNPSASPRGEGSGETYVSASNLSQMPRLGESDPCKGFFPRTATDDVASASVMLTIDARGSVRKVALVSESPANQGFGRAARACMANKHFAPGLDRHGNAAATVIRINVRFTR